MLRKYLLLNKPIFSTLSRTCVHKTTIANLPITNNNILDEKFETVFKFPLVKSIALFNRLKVYQMVGTACAIPTCAVLELTNIVSGNYTLAATCIGVAGTALFFLASIPTRNVIGFLYISEDEKLIKISYVNYWGKREDKIINSEDWNPLLEQPSKTLDAIYLRPTLTDGTSYKLFIKFGIVLNNNKIGRVLE